MNTPFQQPPVTYQGSDRNLGGLSCGLQQASDWAGTYSALLGLMMRQLAALNTPLSPAQAEELAVPDEEDVLVILRRGVESAHFHRQHLSESYSAEAGDAVRDDDEQHPGYKKITFRTKAGVTCYRRLTPESERMAGEMTPPVAHPQSPEDALALLRNAAAKPADRLAALSDLRGTDREADAVTFLAEQVGRPDLPTDWRDAVVFAAEEVHFPPHLHEPLADRLLSLAATLRTAPGATDKVVWSALRRGASLLHPDRAERLLDFLTPAAGIDTRAVALQAITRVFELAPPSQLPSAIADRVFRLSVLHLDPDVFTPGELSAVGRHAVVALAAVGDPRLSAALEAVSHLNRAWLTRRVRGELIRLAREWQARGVRPEEPAVRNLTGALGRGQ